MNTSGYMHMYAFMDIYLGDNAPNIRWTYLHLWMYIFAGMYQILDELISISGFISWRECIKHQMNLLAFLDIYLGRNASNIGWTNFEIQSNIFLDFLWMKEFKHIKCNHYRDLYDIKCTYKSLFRTPKTPWSTWSI